MRAKIVAACLMVSMLSPLTLHAASKDLGNGFSDHGVAVPISNHRGTVATVDGAGRNVLLLWLMDHRGGYELLLIDADTGKSQEFPLPFKNTLGDSPYASILSSGNKFYTHFGNYFVEFDPAKRAYTFDAKTTPQMSMSMTEDDNGLIWSVSYPQSGVVSFDPKRRKFKDYGQVFKQNWPQYPRSIAADDAGWIYFGTGETASQILIFDPNTGKATPVLPEDQRKKGIAYLYRDQNGKVYARALKGEGTWFELYKGQHKPVDAPPNKEKTYIAGSQGLNHTTFPDGTVVKECSLAERRLVTQKKGAEPKTVSFDYKSEGAVVMGAATASNGTVCGGTAFPMTFFSYDPKADKMIYRPAYGQWNTIARQGEHFFVGGYGGGFLLDWEPAKPWVPTKKDDPSCNPLYLTECTPIIHRPTRLVPLPDGKTVIMAGTPQYGYTGGGLLFWDRPSKSRVLLSDAQVIADQSTESLVVLPDGLIVAGTTTTPGTGGEKKASVAEMYLMDLASKKVQWHEAVLPGVQEYTDLHARPDGLVYGIADRKTFFVFDPHKRAIVHQAPIDESLAPTASQQGPRAFVADDGGNVFILCNKGIVQVDPKTHELKPIARAVVPIAGGGDYLDGRIYFINGSHLYSYRLK